MKSGMKYALLALLTGALLFGATVAYRSLTETPSDSQTLSPAPSGSQTLSPSSSGTTDIGTIPPEKRASAPDFTVLDSEGNEVRLSDYAGRSSSISGRAGAAPAGGSCLISTTCTGSTERMLSF